MKRERGDKALGSRAWGFDGLFKVVCEASEDFSLFSFFLAAFAVLVHGFSQDSGPGFWV